MREQITIDISELYKETGTAKLSLLDDYVAKAVAMAGEGNHILLTGAGPVWLYLKIAHALHGKALRLSYSSPVTGEVVVYDHDPY